MKGCLSCKCWRGFHCNERESFITVLERVTRAGKKMCAVVGFVMLIFFLQIVL